MCDTDETGSEKTKQTTVKAIPFHEWVIGKARLYELKARTDLSEDALLDPLGDAEVAELARLSDQFGSVECEEFALLHLAEAIVGGVFIPPDQCDAVRDALVGAWRVFDLRSGEEQERAFSAVKEALEVLGLPESELPKHIGFTTDGGGGPGEDEDDDEDDIDEDDSEEGAGDKEHSGDE